MLKQPEQIEKEKLQTKLWHRFHEACQSYGLLSDGDSVLVGLSGGKDSLALVEFLGRQARIFKPHIRVCTVHVRIKNRNYHSDLSYLKSFCQNAGVDFIVRDTEINGEETKDPCFLCSWFRRKVMLDLAQELNCNKIALGHHRDDLLQTLLMNLMFQGSFSTIPPLLHLDKMPVALIRPLCLIDENDLARYALLSHYEPQLKLCPLEHESSRFRAKQLIDQWSRSNPEIRSSLWNAMENIKYDYLPHRIDKK